MKTIVYLMMALFGAMLAACGGGGTGGNNSVTLTPPLVITSANAKDVASTVLKMTVGSTFDYYNPDWLAKTLQQALKNGTTTQLCNGGATGGGSVDFNLPPAGGSYSVTYKKCINPPNSPYTQGKTFDGVVQLSNLNVTPQPLYLYDDISATVSFSNLKITATTVLDVSLTGGYDIYATYVSTPTSSHHTGSISGSNTITITNNLASKSDILKAFGFQQDTTAGSDYNDLGSFGVSSASLGGSVITSTAAPMGKFTSSRYPNSGTMTITGDLGTKLRIRIIGDENAAIDSQVLIDLDPGLNTGYTAICNCTWAQLDP